MDALRIRSLLDVKGLLKKVSSFEATERTEEYTLDGGRVAINYNKNLEITQVVISGNVPAKVILELKQIGADSRSRVNLTKYGVAFS